MSTAATLRARAKAARLAPQRVAEAGGKALKKQIDQQAKRDTGGDGRLRNMRGAKLSTKLSTVGTGSVSVATVEASGSLGAWAIVERGSKPHTIAARHRRVSRTLKIRGEDWRTGAVRVSGTTGKHTWANTVGRHLHTTVVDAQAAEWQRINGT